jgi:uncharacterized Zn finger protein (UPF0148 family)
MRDPVVAVVSIFILAVILAALAVHISDQPRQRSQSMSDCKHGHLTLCRKDGLWHCNYCDAIVDQTEEDNEPADDETSLRSRIRELETTAVRQEKAASYYIDRINELEAENATLRAGYAEAIEDIEGWGAYASEYFQTKHDLTGCIEAHKAIMNPKEPEHG